MLEHLLWHLGLIYRERVENLGITEMVINKIPDILRFQGGF